MALTQEQQAGIIPDQPAMAGYGFMAPQMTQPVVTPPTSPEEFLQRKAGWLASLEDFAQSTQGKAALMAAGARLLQGTQPGQSGLGTVADALGAGGKAYTAVEQQERAQRIQDEQLQMKRDEFGMQKEKFAEDKLNAASTRESQVEDRLLKQAQRKDLTAEVPEGHPLLKKYKLPKGTTYGQLVKAAQAKNYDEDPLGRGAGGGAGSAAVQNREHLIKVLKNQYAGEHPDWDDKQVTRAAEKEALRREGTSKEKSPTDMAIGLAQAGLVELDDPKLMEKLPKIMENLSKLEQGIKPGANPPGRDAGKPGSASGKESVLEKGAKAAAEVKEEWVDVPGQKGKVGKVVVKDGKRFVDSTTIKDKGK